MPRRPVEPILKKKSQVADICLTYWCSCTSGCNPVVSDWNLMQVLFSLSSSIFPPSYDNNTSSLIWYVTDPDTILLSVLGMCEKHYVFEFYKQSARIWQLNPRNMLRIIIYIWEECHFSTQNTPMTSQLPIASCHILRGLRYL